MTTQAQKVRDNARHVFRMRIKQCLINLDRDLVTNPTMMAVILQSIHPGR